MFTDKQIQKLKPGMHADSGGLYLRVSPKGKRTWVRRSQKDGKDSWHSIGTYPGMSLADARRASQGLVQLVTMDAAVDSYLIKLEVQRPEQVALLLKPLREFKLTASRQELMNWLQERAKVAPVSANRRLTRWKDFFNFCEQQGWVTSNPLGIVQRKYVGGKEKSRSRVLDWQELQGFLTLVLDPHTKLALYFILATGLRPSEALWVLRTKQLTGIPLKGTRADPNPKGKLPAVPHILALLKLVKRVPASHLTLSNAMRRLKLTYTPHDLRRTFATRLSDLGIAPHIIEKCLNHRMEGVMAIYNHAEYWPERVAAMKVWGHKLSHLRRSALAQGKASCSGPP